MGINNNGNKLYFVINSVYEDKLRVVALSKTSRDELEYGN